MLVLIPFVFNREVTKASIVACVTLSSSVDGCPLWGVIIVGIFKGPPSLYFKSLLGAAKLSVCGKGPQNISAIEVVMNQYYTYMFCTCVLPWRFSSQVKLYS